MKKLFWIISLSLLFVSLAFAQTPRFAKYQIGETGYFSYFPGDPGKFEVQKTEDDLLLYLGETEVQACKYGLIMVLFENKLAGSGKKELLDLLIAYLDYLKTSFEITESAGYGKGHTMESNPEAQGVIDYWENVEGIKFVVKGWIDKNALCFLYISGKEEPNYNYQSLFLNGFRFKE